MEKKSLISQLYRIGIPLAALAVILGFTLGRFGLVANYWAELLLATATILWLAHHRFNLVGYDATLIHPITLTLGITIGVAPALISLTAGVLLYALIDLARPGVNTRHPVRRSNIILIWSRIWSRQVLAASVGLYLYFVTGGELAATSSSLPSFQPFISNVFGFSLVYLLLQWVNPAAHQVFRKNRIVTIRLITITLAPMPVVLLAASAYIFLGLASFILYIVILALAAPIFSSLIRMELQLRQRAENLGLLSELSAAVQSAQDPVEVARLILNTSTSIGCGEWAVLEIISGDDRPNEIMISEGCPGEFAETFTAVLAESAQSTMPGVVTEPIFYSPDVPAQMPADLLDLIRQEGITSFVSLPILAPNKLLARLTIFSSGLIGYSPRRRELLSLFASQAAFVLSNAQIHASADETMSLQSDQLSRLEEINRQLTRSSVSDNLHEIILDHAIEASGADGGYLALYHTETDNLHFAAHSGFKPKLKNEGGEPQFASNHGIFGRSFQTGQIINLPNVSNDPLVEDPMGTNSESMLCVPVCGPESMLGVIGVQSSRENAFNPDHEQFLTQLAAYAANALHHAQIYHELQERLTEQSLLYQASTQIAESLESDAVGLAIADSLRVAIQADAASVFHWFEPDGILRPIARIDGGRPANISSMPSPDISRLLGHAQCIKDRVSMQWSSEEEVSSAEKEYLLQTYGKGRLLLLPLSIGERTLGIVEIYRTDIRRFSEAALRSAQSIAIQASIALDNTELFQKISESHNRLTAILNSTREGFLLIDTDGVISIANNQMESLIDLEIKELLRRPIDESASELAPRLGYTRQDLQQLASSLRQGQAQLAGTATFVREHQPGKTFLRMDTPVYDLPGQLIGWLISLRDISEQKEIEDTREQLTEMIVHDLRSPLTAVLNSIVLLRRELDQKRTSSATEQAIAVADRSVNQMLGLVNSLLDISRLESGKMKITTDSCPILPLMMELQERFQLEANSIGIILNPVFNDDDLTLNMDREKIQRVLANLLDNALKFTPVGGVVELGYRTEGRETLFWVSDTGPGIPPEFREKIFERYIQIPGNSGRRRGTGLGLAFARLAVEAHGGTLWVEENPIGGSVFKFSLPTR